MILGDKPIYTESNSIHKTKLYIVSGLGADSKVFENVSFGKNLEPIFIDWLIPKKNETLASYVDRMAKNIDDNEEFYLLGYSFGGIIAQEINRVKTAKRVIILGSIKSHKEKSSFFRWNKFLQLYKFFPMRILSSRKSLSFLLFSNVKNIRKEKIYSYICVRESYYLRWSIHQILNWKGEKQNDIIQIMADKDIVFPIKNSTPDYIIKNASHLFPLTHPKETSDLLSKILV